MAITAIPELDTNSDTELDPGSCAHIVKTEPGQNAANVVLEARVFGTVIEALCGHRWVPSKDPQKLPVCPKCADIYGLYRAANDGLNESPSI